MALTDNTFTADELKAAVTANPALLDIARGYFKESNYVVRTADEETNYVKTLETQHVDGYVGKTAPLVEKAIEEITGIKKEKPEEKWYDLNTRALKDVVTKRDEYKLELDTLKKSSNITEAERELLTNLQDKVKLLNKEIETQKKTGETELNKARLENRVSREMSPVLSKLIQDERLGVKRAQELLSNQIFQEILEMAQEDARKEIILIGKDGKPLLNADNVSFKTVAQYYEEKMTEAGFVDDGKKQPGAGGDPARRSATSIPGNCKTQAELMDWLRDNTMKGKPQTELVAEFDKYASLLPR